MLAVEERGKFADPLTIAAQSRDDVFLRKRGMTLLGETIMGGTEYYQKISLLFS